MTVHRIPTRATPPDQRQVAGDLFREHMDLAAMRRAMGVAPPSPERIEDAGPGPTPMPAGTADPALSAPEA